MLPLPPLSKSPTLRPSTLQLPCGSWTTVFACLCARFPAIDADRWADRFRRGRILAADGTPLAIDHAYRAGLTVHYFREVECEARIPFAERIVHLDAHIAVIDKPHFLAVVPAGRFVEETLLHRLAKRLGNRDLVPLHRIDRGTAGLVMFSLDPDSRSVYQALFRLQKIEKLYEAIAAPLPQLDFPLIRRSRIVRGEPFFRMREIDGLPNSESHIEPLARGDISWRYALRPRTGRKHQLRVHMAALGAAIENDTFYPEPADTAEDHFRRPLKLLARSLAFTDPITGSRRQFESSRTL